MYKQIQNLWKNPLKNMKKEYKEHLIDWRKDSAVVRIAKPTRLDRARRLGYKAKQGIIVVRARVKKGTAKKPVVNHARRPKRHVMLNLPVAKSKQRIAEERSARKYPNLEVLNSYWVGDDSKSEFYEIIMVDPNHARIFSDRKLNFLCKKPSTGRVYRGLTSAGKKSRGIR
ncbi:50S ribosomal protein L15e [Candidatus Woesearchaeota archaeon]|jgi:large subunit ribosomal protein L15e|nr:50S ribosomal protein L15e [Candidatus Woesearchaeota archaeon]MBT7062355.1 50S ribosomal protein L15e [Candidatus Woesearchaeota archaeon]MBT7402826.1 50S ribosomal protein L15e [Candidatus Woesearchaeota archaeon]